MSSSKIIMVIAKNYKGRERDGDISSLADTTAIEIV